MVQDKVMEASPGKMGKNMRGIGKMDSNLDLEYGDLLKVILMKVSGKRTSRRVVVYLSIKVPYIREIS